MDHKALVGAAAHRAFFVVQAHFEGELAAFHSHQLALAGHSHAHGGGSGVLQLQLRAYGAVALGQGRGHAHPTGLFGQGHQGRGGKHVQRAAAHGFCSVYSSDRHALLTADARFQCHKKFPPVRFAQFVVLYFYKIPQLGKECTIFGAFCKKYRFSFRLSVL